MSDLNGPACECGSTVDMVHGIRICPHCDARCSKELRDCQECRRYRWTVLARACKEYAIERTGEDKK